MFGNLSINVDGIVYPNETIFKDVVNLDKPLETLERLRVIIGANNFLTLTRQFISDIYSSPVLTIVFVSSFAFVAFRLVRKLKRV